LPEPGSGGALERFNKQYPWIHTSYFETFMLVRHRFLVFLLAAILLCALLSVFFLNKGSHSPQPRLVQATRRDIKVAVSTNGIIDPVNRSEIYAPMDGRVVQLFKQEGLEIAQGQSLMQLESEPARTALAGAKAALLSGKRQERLVLSGPPKEEMTEVDASIAEGELQLDQTKKDLQLEESLLAKGATARVAVETLQKQRDLLQLRLDGSRKKKSDLLQRYSSEDRAWEQAKVEELAKQVALLDSTLQMESVRSPAAGLIYSLQVRAGSSVTKGQLLAQIYQPGKIMLRAYVDEPDLGRIKQGQTVLVQWDGLPDRKWQGVVHKLAEQVVALNNRSVGYVYCSLEGDPRELIPNLNVKIDITTDRKTDVIVIPKSAVFNPKGKPSVLLSEGKSTATKPVDLGLVTSDEVEILSGLKAGDLVVLYPGEVAK
jgi:HlyD family secretion protein